MKRFCSLLCRPTLACLLFLLGSFPPEAAAQSTVLYSSGFEQLEGFDPVRPLAKQAGWIGVDGDARIETNGNGIVESHFPDSDQQAFIGFAPLSGTNYSLNVWHPLNFDPIAAGKPVVTFSVQMAIVDSTFNVFDCFRWSVYNTNNGGTRLFTLDFDNTTLEINYLLEGGSNQNFVSTGYAFEHGIYDLEVMMNFASNLWSAKLKGSGNDVLLVNAQKITTKGSALNLGDIDAVWVYGPSANAPGDNYMVFDNYHVTAEAAAPLPFELEPLGRLSDGTFLLRLTGEPGRRYALEASTNLLNWSAVKTNVAGSDGSLILDDPTASGRSRGFYRARFVP